MKNLWWAELHRLQIITFSILVTTEASYVIIGAVTSKGEGYHEVLREGRPGHVVTHSPGLPRVLNGKYS